MANIKTIGEGKVELIAGGGKVYTDIAARFVRSERDLEDIIATPYNKELVKTIIKSGHEACTEFDWFVFGVEGYARVSEVQLVRKRLASYMIKSGRAELNGKRSFDVVMPDSIKNLTIAYPVDPHDVIIDDTPLDQLVCVEHSEVEVFIKTKDILNIIEGWYNTGVNQGIAEEDLRYMKPQATEFKALIGMNAHSLRDWFRIRCCKNAQGEIRDLAMKMLSLCKQAAPDLFMDAGPNCVRMGYCPENDMQHEDCKGVWPTKDTAMKILKDKYKNKVYQCNSCGIHQQGPDKKEGGDCFISNCEGKLIYKGVEYYGERNLR
ncbi:MAG: FAD-dependent thymidylate synthase [Halanaerobiales bacterium]